MRLRPSLTVSLTVSLTLAALLAAASPVHAQGSPPVNLLGTIDAVDAGTISVRQPDGAVRRLPLAPDLLVIQARPATLADVHPGDFVASAAVRGRDGALHSTELRIFPAAMRGVGEGQRPMNDAQGQTMTNATVTGAAIANGSNTLSVTFAGGQSALVVDPGIPVTRLDAADRTLLAPGASVRVQGLEGTASRITVQ